MCSPLLIRRLKSFCWPAGVREGPWLGSPALPSCCLPPAQSHQCPQCSTQPVLPAPWQSRAARPTHTKHPSGFDTSPFRFFAFSSPGVTQGPLAVISVFLISVQIFSQLFLSSLGRGYAAVPCQSPALPRHGQSLTLCNSWIWGKFKILQVVYARNSEVNTNSSPAGVSQVRYLEERAATATIRKWQTKSQKPTRIHKSRCV